jgi:putative transposase
LDALLITPEIEEQIFAAIAAKCKELNCHLLAIGGVADHVHLLVRFPTTLSAATLAGEAIGASSHLITHRLAPGEFFKWQGAYGAFTVQKDGIDTVTAYIKNQKAHHASNDLIPTREKCENIQQ